MAVASPINLGKTSAFRKTRQGVSKANKSIQNISGFLFRKTKFRRESIASSNILTRKRIENEDRAEREAEAEAQKNIRTPSGRQKISNDAGGSFLDRIIGFIGYTALGWFLNNIPTWIGLGKEFIARLQKAGQIISSIANDTIRIVTGFGNVLGAVGKNIISFDILDNSKRLETALNDLNAAFFDMHTQFRDGFDLVGTPLTEAKYSGEEIPGLGTQQVDEGAYPETPAPSGGPVSGIHRQALDIIAGPESGGNYNAMNQGTDAQGRILGSGDSKKIIGKALTDMTIGEVIDRQNESKYPRNAKPDRGIHAAGKYQIIGMTLPGAMKRAGLKPSDKFSPENQDLLGLAVLKSQGIGAWTAGGSRYSAKETAIIKQAQRTPLPTSPLSQVASNKSVGLKSIGGGHQLASSAAEAFLKMKSAAAAEGVNLTLSSSYRSYEKQAYLYQLYKQGRGNLAAPPGTSKHEKGLAIDVENGIPWVQKNAKKFGWKATVASEDWHFEYLGGGGITPSPVISTPPSQQMEQQITPERTGQDIFIFNPEVSTPTPTPQPSRGEGTSVITDEFSMLNNYIKKQLLLDLVYL